MLNKGICLGHTRQIGGTEIERTTLYVEGLDAINRTPCTGYQAMLA